MSEVLLGLHCEMLVMLLCDIVSVMIVDLQHAPELLSILTSVLHQLPVSLVLSTFTWTIMDLFLLNGMSACVSVCLSVSLPLCYHVLITELAIRSRVAKWYCCSFSFCFFANNNKALIS